MGVLISDILWCNKSRGRICIKVISS